MNNELIAQGIGSLARVICSSQEYIQFASPYADTNHINFLWYQNICHYECRTDNEGSIYVAFHAEGPFSGDEKNSLLKRLNELCPDVFLDTTRKTTELLYAKEKNETDAVTKLKEFISIYDEKIARAVAEFAGIGVSASSVENCVIDGAFSEYSKLLLNNHNIILHGAPGTGKTYLAKEIAKEMGCTENEIGFVQFHQSYDYTDFVEGLRPLKKDGNSDVYFDLVDGVFKNFCEKALLNLRGVNEKSSPKTKSFESLLEKFLTSKEDSEASFSLKKGDHFSIDHFDDRRIYINNPKIKRIVKIYKNDMIRLLEEKSIDNVSAIKTIFKRGHRQKDSYMFSLFGEIKKLPEYNKICEVESTSETEAVSNETGKEPRKNFVFIIDEINRGEMSKILGELFYAIDPGYRVSWNDICNAKKQDSLKSFIRTQYANMNIEANEWDDVLDINDENSYGHFFVPENVYIIGTMNDIDRSVESMDFAMRRRFAFKEVTANDRKDMLYDKDCGLGDLASDAENRMIALNKAIWDDKTNKGITGLSSAYHIGPAYFLKLKNYKDNERPFDDLWENHLKGVLQEYLRGMEDAKSEMDKLAAAYGYTDPNKNEN